MNEIRWSKENGVWTISFIIGNEKSSFTTKDDAFADTILTRAFNLRRQWNQAMEKLQLTVKKHVNS